MAAATCTLSPVYGQQVAEPEGMPVYRQKKSSFFQNPFSNSYQKIWNRAKSTDAPVKSSPAALTAAGSVHEAIGDEATVISVDGQPVSAPAKKFVKNRAGRVLHTARKATDDATQQIQQGVDKVLHVKDVNEGTLPLGHEADVQADEALIKTLANGEQILNVKERVIGIYRDGKLVPVEALKGTTTRPVATVPAAPVRKEVDPWFGDTVTAPSEEIRSGEPAAPAELTPPQSESAIPVLQGEEVIEATSYTTPSGEEVTLLVPTQTITHERVVGVQIGEEVPAKMPVQKQKVTKPLAKQIIPFVKK
jgi:hypothetical protein